MYIVYIIYHFDICYIYIIHKCIHMISACISHQKIPLHFLWAPRASVRIPGLVKKLGLLGITIEEAESLFDIMDVNHSALAPFQLLRKSMAETGRNHGENATVG